MLARLSKSTLFTFEGSDWHLVKAQKAELSWEVDCGLAVGVGEVVAEQRKQRVVRRESEIVVLLGHRIQRDEAGRWANGDLVGRDPRLNVVVDGHLKRRRVSTHRDVAIEVDYAEHHICQHGACVTGIE